MDSVRFTCQRGCINCCTMVGYVYLTEDDLKRAAAFGFLSGTLRNNTIVDDESAHILIG